MHAQARRLPRNQDTGRRGQDRDGPGLVGKAIAGALCRLIPTEPAGGDGRREVVKVISHDLAALPIGSALAAGPEVAQPVHAFRHEIGDETGDRIPVFPAMFGPPVFRLFEWPCPDAEALMAGLPLLPPITAIADRKPLADDLGVDVLFPVATDDQQPVIAVPRMSPTGDIRRACHPGHFRAGGKTAIPCAALGIGAGLGAFRGVKPFEPQALTLYPQRIAIDSVERSLEADGCGLGFLLLHPAAYQCGEADQGQYDSEIAGDPYVTCHGLYGSQSGPNQKRKLQENGKQNLSRQDLLKD